MSCWIDGRECSILSAGDERGILNARVEFCRDCERLKFWQEHLKRQLRELGVEFTTEETEEDEDQFQLKPRVREVIITHADLIDKAIENRIREIEFELEVLEAPKEENFLLGDLQEIRDVLKELV